MNKIILTLLIGSSLSVSAQKLVWTSQTGGTNNNGAIIQHDLQTQQTSTLGSLDGNFMRGFELSHEEHFSDAEYHTEGLIAGSDGNMYGVSTQISSHAQQQLGGIYKLETATNKLVLLHTFSSNRVPRNDQGVFNYSALDHGLRNPVFGLVEGTPGVFYGITNHGGLYEQGGIYKFDANGAGYSKILDFDTLSSGGLGLGPLSPLIIGKDGNLFGVLYYVPTQAPADQGFLYKIDITTDVVSIQAPLGAAGWAISGPVDQISYSSAGNGKIYGTKEEFTASGHGGGVYSYDFGSGVVTNETFITIAQAPVLGEYGHGISPIANDGNHYFLTRAGGANGAGTLMKYDAGLNTMLKVHDFSTSPSGTGMIVNGSKVYGTYNQLTTPGLPILWSYDVSTLQFSDVLTGTNDNTLGYYMSPSFSIVGGELFGITLLGGSSNAGSLFRHNLGTGQTTIIQNNQSVEGRGLVGEIEIINDSIAYAHILAGGEEIVSGESAEQGGLARINLVTGSVQLDAMNSAFLNTSRRNAYKYNAPLFSQSENLYVSHYYSTPGVKHNNLHQIDLSNGTNNQVMGSDVERLTYGALEYQPGKIMYNLTNAVFVYDELTQISTPYPVTPSDSGFMCNNIILASNGKVYGTTIAVGILDPLKKCMIYSVDTNTFVRSVEYVFDSPVKELNNGLTEYNGKLYGSTIAGGTNGDGYLFSYDMSGTLTIEYSFDASVDGGAFLGEWTVYNGVLYAVSFAGGANGYGTLASFEVNNSTFTVLEDFTIDNGRALRATPAFWDDSWVGIDEKKLNDAEFIIYPNPTDRYLYLENGNIENVSVYSIEGRQERVEFTESLIDLQGLAPGVYIISITVPEGQFQKRVVIK